MKLHRAGLPSSWYVADTGLILHRVQHVQRWMIISMDPALERWLTGQGLRDAQFARRQDALRTVSAHLAAAPLPPSGLKRPAQLRRLDSGKYCTADGEHVITRVSDGGWMVCRRGKTSSDATSWWSPTLRDVRFDLGTFPSEADNVPA